MKSELALLQVRMHVHCERGAILDLVDVDRVALPDQLKCLGTGSDQRSGEGDEPYRRIRAREAPVQGPLHLDRGIEGEPAAQPACDVSPCGHGDRLRQRLDLEKKVAKVDRGTAGGDPRTDVGTRDLRAK